MKHICVLGSGISGLGKGIVAASCGTLLKSNYKITIQKYDPYLNVDAGTQNPICHGEVFVLSDGKECDLDIGHYKRFTDGEFTKKHSVTSGTVYSNVINKERSGKYLGKTVQVIPHITNEILEYMHCFDDDYDIVIHEIGGTVGDVESLPYVESLRQLKQQLKDDCVILLLTYLPFLKTSQEVKTKVAQQGAEKLRSLGIIPDILICRTEQPIDDTIKDKLSMFCNVDKSCIIENLDADSIYYVPDMLYREGLATALIHKLHLNCEADITDWNNIVYKYTNETIKIGLVGKYVELHDAYLSVNESLRFAGWENNVNVEVVWIDASKLEDDRAAAIAYLDSLNLKGIIIPGGFGNRGIEGMILAANYAREKKIPYLGICLGMQIAVIEFARYVLRLRDANSTEFNTDSNNQVIHIMDDQKHINDKGASCRLGTYPCRLIDAQLRDIYNDTNIDKIHRHRYEFNNAYRDRFESNGMQIVGTSPDDALVEIIKVVDHPFFIGCQYHPEFDSVPGKSEPLFASFVMASKETNRIIGK